MVRLVNSFQKTGVEMPYTYASNYDTGEDTYSCMSTAGMLPARIAPFLYIAL